MSTSLSPDGPRHLPTPATGPPGNRLLGATAPSTAAGFAALIHVKALGAVPFHQFMIGVPDRDRR